MSRPRRSVLFMPGDSARKIEKAAGLEVDVVVVDLEDGVALDRKAEARAIARDTLRGLDLGPRERMIRLNPVSTGLGLDDLRGTLDARPDAYVIPKASTPEDVEAVDNALDELGGEAREIRLVAIVETALGVVHAADIARSSPRLVALGFGAEDLAGDMGAERTRSNAEVAYARGAVAIAAAAYGLDALDMVFVDLEDLEGLERETVEARRMGYAGKMAIHPRQLPVIHRAFAPSREEIERARRLVAAHDAHQASGTGVFAFEGKMVDMPLVRTAERVLERARASGLLEPPTDAG